MSRREEVKAILKTWRGQDGAENAELKSTDHYQRSLDEMHLRYNVEAELAAANATLGRLRKCEIDPTQDGNPYHWTREDLVSTLQAMQAILYPKEAT